MAQTSKPGMGKSMAGKQTGKNQTSIFNPKTKSQNTNANTKTEPGKKPAIKAGGVAASSSKSASGISQNSKPGGRSGGMTAGQKAGSMAKQTMNAVSKTGFGSNKTVKSAPSKQSSAVSGGQRAMQSSSSAGSKAKAMQSPGSAGSKSKAMQSPSSAGSKAKAMQSTGNAGSKAKAMQSTGNSNSKQKTMQQSSNQQKGVKGGINTVMAKTKSSAQSKSQSLSGSNSKSGAKSMEASSELCQLKDMDIISDVLGGQKALIKLYGTAICECDCPKLRSVLTTQMTEAASDQFDAFSYMNQRGMYPTEQAPSSKVKQAIQQYSKKESAFNKKN